jgi:ubiquinone/menaquinone biosynthesis C-methylase UbiE
MTEKRFNPEKAQLLMRMERKELLPPEEIVEKLDIKPDHTITDLGAGNGYFAIPMAKRTKELVYAVDIEPKMLGVLKENGGKAQVENIQNVESDLDRIQLNDHSLHKVMISFVMHEVPDIDKTISEIKRILKPGGTIMVIEWEPVQTASGPPFHITISSEEMVKILEENGFDAEIISLNPENYAVKAALV